MADDFGILEARIEETRVLRVSGRLDARNAQALVQECERLLADGQRNIVLNLADVSFVASSGIGSLLALTETFRDRSGGLHLVRLSPPVRSVVDLLNLGQFLSIAASEEAAVQALGA
jgi:anti-anti-sigma factor